MSTYVFFSWSFSTIPLCPPLYLPLLPQLFLLHLFLLTLLTAEQSLIFNRNERKAVRDKHLFSGLFCYLMRFWIVLLTKSCENVQITVLIVLKAVI